MDVQPSNWGSNSLVVPTGFTAPPTGYVFLCCPHVGPYPAFEQLQDRRMEWSPIFASGAWSFLSGCVVSVAAQWVIRLHFQESLVLVAESSAQCSSPISHRVILECGVPVASFRIECDNP